MACVTGLPLVLLLRAAAAADEPVADTGLLSLEPHGFASQGFILNTGNYLVADSTRGSFQFSELGLNFSKELADKLRFGVQFFAQNFGPTGNYTPQVDWFNILSGHRAAVHTSTLRDSGKNCGIWRSQYAVSLAVGPNLPRGGPWTMIPVCSSCTAGSRGKTDTAWRTPRSPSTGSSFASG